MPGKRVQIDDQTWAALEALMSDHHQTFQQLAEEAFVDLLQKHARPRGFKAALKQSVGARRKRPARGAKRVGASRPPPD